jgi:hypothetical protein
LQQHQQDLIQRVLGNKYRVEVLNSETTSNKQIEDKINKIDSSNSEGKKQKKILKDKKQVLEKQLKNQKDFIKLNDSIIYYKKK